MEDKEIDFLVGEYLRFWDELGIEDLASREAALQTHVRSALAPSRPAPPPAASLPSSLDEVRRALGAACGNPDCRRDHQPVFGAGNPQAKLVFVGEAPGPDEDRTGLPFQGADGQLLTKIIEAMGYSRDQVYLTYALKCGTDTPAERERSVGILRAQVAAIAPRCIVALGPLAAEVLIGASTRGRWHPMLGNPAVAVMPTLPLSRLLNHAADKKTVWEEMKKVKARLMEASG